MSANLQSTVNVVSDTEISMTRVFDAPRELVFQAYTDPAIIPQWWGPRRYTTTVEKMDVRVGGQWRYVQRDANGAEFAFNGEYREITPPSRLVSTFEFEGMPGHIIIDTAEFEALPDGKTRLTTTSLFASKADRDGMLSTDMASGANESWDRLSQVLEQLSVERK